MYASILEIVQSGKLPTAAPEILPLLTNEDGTYLNQEGTVWDFKREWPKSYSDSYFAGLCRLVCAFANTEGGIIVFGVDDKTRLADKSPPNPNLDRFEQSMEQLCGRTPELEIRRYTDIQDRSVDILLVRRKLPYTRPFRFSNDTHGYPKAAIFIRRGSQVQAATINDITTLYLRNEDDDANLSPRGHLPPSPATVREFVGRMDAIDRIFNWLSVVDEPRAFLFGKGGSGKSTIAYQVYKSIKISGNSYKISDSNLDRLIFISAKSRFLDVESAKSAPFVGLDFSNEKELYQAILVMGDADLDDARIHDIEYLKSCIKTFLDENSCFIVIDDIDTLSTAKEETGMDFLFGALWKAKKSSKILYTLRNRPTQSLSNSLEIKGMEGAEFETFLSVCAKQFGVPEPQSKVRDNMILPISEGRPLVIESIVALRRTTGNYPDAVKLFESEAGSDVRDYVFRREWDALDKTDRGREILTILALYNKPMLVDDIVTISRMDASKVGDALASVQEIFLNSDSDSDETIYSVGTLTRKFILNAAKSLDLYETIKVRVDNFKNTFYPDSPLLNSYIQKFHRAEAAFLNGEERYLRDLLSLLENEKNPKLSEDPRFLCLRGSTRLTLDYRDISKARLDFQNAMDFKHSPEPDQLILWMKSEKKGDSGDSMTEEILERVQTSKGFNFEFKNRVKFDRAAFLFSRGKNYISLEPHRAVDMLGKALMLHTESLRGFISIDSTLVSRSEEFTRNTCFTLANHLNHSTNPDQFFEIILDIANEGRAYIDPLVEPICWFMRGALQKKFQRKDSLQKRIGKFERMSYKLLSKSVWYANSRKLEFDNSVKEVRDTYKQLISNL